VLMKQRIVIKLGGSSLQNTETLHQLSLAVQGHQKRGFDVVVVHGGGPAINAELTKRGIEWKFINGQRQTTPAMISVIEDVLGKDVNSMIVRNLADAQISAVGLSGANGILSCTQSSKELMQVGSVDYVDTTSIEEALASAKNCVPVIAPIGFGENGMKFNVNADWAATKIAIALNAVKLIFLTDQNGILDQDKNLVKRANPKRIHSMIDTGVIHGGMCTKVLAMMAALESGVDQVRVVHASQAGQLFGNVKIGTVLTDNQNHNRKDVVHEYAS
ncbi:MAG: acetylglutamate kinase, partial [Bdellovibrionota bacterium]